MSYKLVFEPGMHSTSSSERSEVYEELMNGNPNSNEWNIAVTERIRSYSPTIIAIDSLCCESQTPSEYDINYKTRLWSMLPDRPSKLNGKQHIYVLSGDNLFGFNDHQTAIKRRALHALGYSAAYGLGAVGGLVVNGTLDKVSSVVSPSAPDARGSRNKGFSSRREFLKVSGGIAALASIYGANLVSTYSPWSAVSKTAERINDDTEFLRINEYFDDNSGVDARTALLINKTMDAFDRLSIIKNKVGSIVMGNAHLTRYADLIDDPKMRTIYIRRHTENMNKSVDKVPHDDGQTTLSTELQKRIIYDQQTCYALFKVSEPNDVQFKDSPMQEISRIVQPIGVYKTQSIVDALSAIK